MKVSISLKFIMDEFTLLRSAMLYMKEQSTKSKLDFPQLETIIHRSILCCKFCQGGTYIAKGHWVGDQCILPIIYSDDFFNKLGLFLICVVQHPL